MYKTTKMQSDPSKAITTDVRGLMALTGLGKATAMKIGEESGALIKIGRRNIYKVDVLREYLNNL